MTKHFLLGFLLLPSISFADQIFNFTSTNGVVETCRTLSPLPGAEYDRDDLEDELKLCSIDFYDQTKVALCPKTWSTSPGTMVYDISQSGLSQRDYESRRSCGGTARGHEKITKFKQTMNQSGTSGTFSTSSLLYYHLSRYLHTNVKVPVYVYRTMDRSAHFERVTKKAHEQSLGKGKMIRSGWKWLYDSEKDPKVYRPTDDLFTPDLSQIYGILGDAGGERYGEHINGIRSGWGDRQNEDFQNTPAFLALREEAPLLDAIEAGLQRGLRNPKIKKAMGPSPEPFQMALWMKELSEIAILDYILNQQDRIGNIDFKWYIYWLTPDGKVKKQRLKSDLPRSQMSQVERPTHIEGQPTILVQRTRIIDNDAGGKTRYANFTKRTKMLEKIRHLDAKTFEQLERLNADLQSQGPVYQLLSSEYNLDEKELASLVKNTKEAKEIFSNTIANGKMNFDLNSPKKMFKLLVQGQ
ncbi:hypothetical protein GW916_05635 [bacterium]|nr:hypothetical protein [bacterium]